jgi:hypothetical protein
MTAPTRRDDGCERTRLSGGQSSQYSCRDSESENVTPHPAQVRFGTDSPWTFGWW